jgi:hypothetical protein
VTAYRYPDDDGAGPDMAVEIERRRRAWHQARTDRDVALRRFYDAVRAELAAEVAFRDVALEEPVTP